MQTKRQQRFVYSVLIAFFVLVVVGCSSTGNGNVSQDEPAVSQSDNDNDAAADTADTSEDTAEDGAGPPAPDTISEATSHTGMVLALESTLLNPTDRSPIAKGTQAPDFSYTLVAGTQHKLSDFRGQKVMLNFWATWCPPCNAEMPDIQEAAVRFEDKGFTVLALSQDAQVELIEPFAQKYALTFPLIADPRNEIASRYGARGLPSSYFVNTDGTIHSVRQGMVDVETIEQRIEEMQ